MGWWNVLVLSHGGGFWDGKVVAHHSLNNSQVGVRIEDLLINSEVWNEVVLWWSWLWLLGWDDPLMVEVSLSLLSETESSLDILILAEVGDDIVDWVSDLALILVVGQEAVSGVLRGGAGWVVHHEGTSHRVTMMVMVVVTEVDGGSLG